MNKKTENLLVKAFEENRPLVVNVSKVDSFQQQYDEDKAAYDKAYADYLKFKYKLDATLNQMKQIESPISARLLQVLFFIAGSAMFGVCGLMAFALLIRFKILSAEIPFPGEQLGLVLVACFFFGMLAMTVFKE
jgi:hypothetical protein